LESALADSLYAGYLKNQETTWARLHSHDSMRIPEGLKYATVGGLSREMVERLERVRPRTFGEARSIPGLTVAAASALLCQLSIDQSN
jgi:tRNA uridine 5-carboxymethylaminomethyl modification enzyme